MLNFSKKNKKIIIGLLMVFFYSFYSSFFCVNVKTIEVKANEYKETLNSEYSFYNCAIAAYNKENNTEYKKLTDEQLSTIKEMSCSYISATDETIAGSDILKKMTNLESLSVSVVDNLDLSNNKKLKSLTIYYGVYEGELDLSNNTELEKLSVYISAFKNYNLSKNTKLNRLVLAMLPITSIDLSNNISLTELVLGYTQLSQLDLTNNINLKNLDLEYNQFTAIDLSKNTNLESLILNSNQISSLDLSNNILLKEVDASYNLLSSIDLSKNLNLETIYFSDNQFEEINLTNNTLLKEVNLDNNNLKKIDLSKNTNLLSLNIYNNLLEKVDLRKNKNLMYIDISYNSLKEIYMYDGYKIYGYDFYNQVSNQTLLDFGNDRIIKPSEALEFYVSDRIVFRSNAIAVPYDEFLKKLGLKNLSVKIKRNNVVVETDNVLSGDVIYIYDGENEVLMMDFQVIVNQYFNDSEFYNCVINSYNSENDLNLSYDYNLTEEELASIKSLFCLGLDIRDTKGLEKMTSLENLELLYAYLDKIDLTKNTKLTYLNLTDNSLAEIDLSQNKELKELDLSSNNLINIDLSNNTQIEKLDLYSNSLVSIDLSNNKKLSNVDLGWNDLENIDVSGSDSLKMLDISYNELENINLTNNTELEFLDINSNYLTSIDLVNNKKLTVADLSWNDLENINITGCEMLKELNVNYNEFKTIDLSKNIKLKTLKIVDYSLKELNLDNTFELESLEVYAYLPSLDLSKHSKLTYLDVSIYNDTTLYINDVKQLPLFKLADNLNCELTSISIGTNSDRVISFNSEDMTVVGNFADYDDITIEYKSPEDSEYSLYYREVYNIYVVELSSKKYKVDATNNYVYTGIDTTSDKILQNIFVSSQEGPTVSIENNKINLKHMDEKIREFDIKNIDFGQLDVNNGVITYNSNMTYESLIKNINTNGVTYKIFNGETEITSGEITIGTKIIVYVNNEKIDEYYITDEFLNFSEDLKIANNVIFNLKEGIKASELLSMIKSSEKINIKNKDGNIFENDDVIGTGSKVIIELSSGLKEYTLAITGDVTGDGIVNIADVLKIADHTITKDKLTDYEKYAAEVTKDENLNIADVLKIADYTLDKKIEIWR